MAQRITIAAAETRSFKRAAIVVKEVGGQPVCAKSIERLVHDVGQELVQRRDGRSRSDEALAKAPADPPDLAVVECDGGAFARGNPDTDRACLVMRPDGGKPRTPV